MKTRYISLVAVVALMMVFGSFVSTASADSFFDVFFDITYKPPQGTPFEGKNLGGRIDMYTLDRSGNSTLFGCGGPTQGCAWLGKQTIGDPSIEPQGSFSFGFEDLMISEENGRPIMFFTFNGLVAYPDAPEVYPAYAFGIIDPDLAPKSGPMLDIAGGVAPIDYPIFAFASPGTRVGTIRVTATQVPEPATLLLIGSGLAGIAVLRNRLGRKEG